MKLIFRDTSASRFAVNGGLFSWKVLPNSLNLTCPEPFTDFGDYRNGLGFSEANVEDFVIKSLESLGWDSVTRGNHDVLAAKDDISLLIECKKYRSNLLYLDNYFGGGIPNETAPQELCRNLVKQNITWGVLTDGHIFRLYKNVPDDPVYQDVYFEISLSDIVDSHGGIDSIELAWLIDLLSAESSIRKLDTRTGVIESKHVRHVLKTIDPEFCKDRAEKGKTDFSAFESVIKALTIACLEDMGVRPLHRVPSIKQANTKEQLLEAFEFIGQVDGEIPFHDDTHELTDAITQRIHDMFQKLDGIDFSHIDHAFFGQIYQKLINNGNASHYTNTKISREMADYLACRNPKSQRNLQPVNLVNAANSFILDPAVGSGQLLRALLPFHTSFSKNTTKGIQGWRALASKLAGRDIDKRAIWLAKLNIWISTAAKGEDMVPLPQFKDLDVIHATMYNRQVHMKTAFGFGRNDKIVGVVSNPPWDAFKNDQRQDKAKFDPEYVKDIKRCLDIRPRQLNRAQIFTSVIQLLGLDDRFRFAIVLPDSFFVDQFDELRMKVLSNLDFYFSFPRNNDPIAGSSVFPQVDRTKKFGIIFGRTKTEFTSLRCYPYGNDRYSIIENTLSQIGEHFVFPLMADVFQEKIVEAWKAHCDRRMQWSEGEFHQSSWAKIKDRKESKDGTFIVLKGDSFCLKNRTWSRKEADKDKTWKKMWSVSKKDKKLRNKRRLVFLDYLNNSKKLAYASHIEGVNVANKLMYVETFESNDWCMYESPFYSTLVELYATSQNFNAWRLCAFALPATPCPEEDPLLASAWLGKLLDLSNEEWDKLYTLNAHWLGFDVSREEWQRVYHNYGLESSA